MLRIINSGHPNNVRKTKDSFQELLNHIYQKEQIKQVKGNFTQYNLSQPLPQDSANLQLNLVNNLISDLGEKINIEVRIRKIELL